MLRVVYHRSTGHFVKNSESGDAQMLKSQTEKGYTMKAKPVILVVDDQPENIELLEAHLVPQGYEVLRAENGEAALQAIGENAVDLVLLDVMMPKLDGFEVCRRIKGDQRLRNIPVVMLTSLSAKEDRIKGIEAGAEDFISKPLDKGEVLARIKMLLKQKELTDNLTNAYDNINRLTKIGENIIKTFDPLNFNFKAEIDGIVGQIIRQKSDMTDQPQIVLVSMLNEKNAYEWYRYKYTLTSVERLEFSEAITLNLPKAEYSRLLFYNEPALEGPTFQSFVERLRGYDITPRNMVAYVSNNLSIFALNYARDVTAYDAAVLNSLVMQTLFLRSLSSQILGTTDAFEYTVKSLARASEVNDEDTGKHVLRVGLYSALLAKKLDKPDSFVDAIRIQALLHDVGKIHIPSSVLKNPDELSAGEWFVMKQHPLLGAKIIGDHPRFDMAKAIAFTHHERWDGTGYPNGLHKENIPLEGRIAAIADIYDAIRNARIYKVAYNHRDTCEILTKGDGRTMPKHFDPVVLDAFTGMRREFEDVYEANND